MKLGVLRGLEVWVMPWMGALGGAGEGCISRVPPASMPESGGCWGPWKA